MEDRRVCVECGKDAIYTDYLHTGWVEIDGIEVGQSASFCEDHWPQPGEPQPRDCRRVRYVWAEWGKEDNDGEG